MAATIKFFASPQRLRGRRTRRSVSSLEYALTAALLALPLLAWSPLTPRQLWDTLMSFTHHNG